MCFHTSNKFKTTKIEKRFAVDLVNESMRSYFDTPKYHLNGFTHPNMLVIPQERSHILAPGIWGIVPSNNSKEEIKPYYKEAVRYGGGLNARSEKVFDHFIYHHAIYEQRCIIPVSGFFEPHEFNGKKYPFHFKATDDTVLALAGLYTVIDTYITFTILTKEASPLFAKIHNKKNRQPVLLEQDLVHNWLSSDLLETDIKELLNTTFPEDKLETYPVSKDLFNPKVDSNIESILDKVVYNELVM